jgi:hypothetical protein
MDAATIFEILAKVDWVQVFTITITILFFISEALGNIPQVKENSIYQVAKKAIKLIYSTLPQKKKFGKLDKKALQELDKEK